MRRGGKVTIAFTLNKNGSIDVLEIVQSSGHRSLKKAALKAIKLASAFPPFPQHSLREKWSFTTDLEFQLN